MVDPKTAWNILKGIRDKRKRKSEMKKQKNGGLDFIDKIINFFFGTFIGLLIVFAVIAAIFYSLMPVFLHSYLFEEGLLRLYVGLPIIIGFSIGGHLSKKYVRSFEKVNKKTYAISMSFYMLPVMILLIPAGILNGVYWCQIYKDAEFMEVQDLPRVSTELPRFTPAQVAAEEIVRRTQTSEFTPGKTRPIGSETGVAYIAPLIPQGFWNTMIQKNSGFMYFDDGGVQETAQRVSSMKTEAFVHGEGMEIFDDIYRFLIYEIGFFKTYPEIYYAPVYEKGELVEIVGVVPYISYRFFWGLFIPSWGGVAIFHENGEIEDLAPEEAVANEWLLATQRVFPEEMVTNYVTSERYDEGIINGWIKRPGKIEIPKLPGKEQQPFFLPMEDGTYQYLTTVEPDGDAYSLMRIYMVNAQTGERTFYRFDVEGRNEDPLQGPAKTISYVKSIPGYNWYEDDGDDKSGSYRIVEPRPVTRRGSDKLYWMLSITPVDYAGVVATVFVDSRTNEVIGPLYNREEVFAWLQGREVEDEKCSQEAQEGFVQQLPTEFCESLLSTCQDAQTFCVTPE